MAYESNQVYAKYLSTGSSSDSGCSDCNGNSSSEECSCCPPGLVAVFDENGVAQGCLTPSDAELWMASRPCKDGYVKLYKNSPTETFLGCVSQEEFAALYAAVNPPVV
jgi:hypothetical protein